MAPSPTVGGLFRPRHTLSIPKGRGIKKGNNKSEGNKPVRWFLSKAALQIRTQYASLKISLLDRHPHQRARGSQGSDVGTDCLVASVET